MRDSDASEVADPPEYFADLHLDDIVTAVTARGETRAVRPFFWAPLHDVGTITYRQEVFRDLEEEASRGVVRTFAARMLVVRTRLGAAAKVPNHYERERWFLDAATAYCQAVQELSRELSVVRPRSRGLLAFADYLLAYSASEEFTRLIADTERVMTALASVRYRLRINPGKVTVNRYHTEPDYSAEVLQTFEKFKQGVGKEYRWEFSQRPSMNHVQAAIVDRLALLYPDVFASLDVACLRHRAFLDPTIARFAHEIQFYIAYLDHLATFRRAGLAFCYPEVVERPGDLHGRGVFDLALAARLVGEHVTVTNDFELTSPERILVVSGPNQGGKTTFARTVGQLHHLARLGAPVPGTAARLQLVDLIFTHFERKEEVEDLTSKLENDLLRIQRILDAVTADSLLIMNESFSSTTVSDQLFIGRRVMRKIIDGGLLCVVVTFLDELASLDPSTVSMVSTVHPEEPAQRTFKIVRHPADGLAYAMAIAEKHRLTYQGVKARVAR